MDHLDKLENKSVHIIREAYAAFGNLCMLWSIGKDSTVLLWLARKASFPQGSDKEGAFAFSEKCGIIGCASGGESGMCSAI